MSSQGGHAAEAVRGWRGVPALSSTRVAVNISPRQFQQKNLVATVRLQSGVIQSIRYARSPR